MKGKKVRVSLGSTKKGDVVVTETGQKVIVKDDLSEQVFGTDEHFYSKRNLWYLFESSRK